VAHVDKSRRSPGFQPAKAVSLHRWQILRDLPAMQAVAAELSGYAGKFRCYLEGKI
jgi:hypothetical protein